MTGRNGADTFIIQSGDSIARTTETITSANMANGETIEFGQSVDRISEFVSGTDKLDVTTAGNFTRFGLGSNASNLTANNNYAVRGDWNNGNNVFTLNFAGGADLLVVTNAANADIDSAAQLGIVILQNITTLVAGDFI